MAPIAKEVIAGEREKRPGLPCRGAASNGNCGNGSAVFIAAGSCFNNRQASLPASSVLAGGFGSAAKIIGDGFAFRLLLGNHADGVFFDFFGFERSGDAVDEFFENALVEGGSRRGLRVELGSQCEPVL